MRASPVSFWHPLWAGLALGLVLWFTFMLTGHGLGASGFFTRLTAWLGDAWFSEATANNAYLGGLVSSGEVLSAWISWEMLGVIIGAGVSALGNGRFQPKIAGGRVRGVPPRLIMALLGGLLTGFGARLARGCTSGLGLSGGAALAVAGFVFLLAFFAAGFLVSALTRRLWE